MINHHSCELFFDDLRIPKENLLGTEGAGFKVILDGMNAERILIAAECIGDGRYFIDKASHYATERVVFDRPIGQNQGYSSLSLVVMPRWRPLGSWLRKPRECLTQENPAAPRPIWRRC